MTWTKITYADEAAAMLPAWLIGRMVGLRGSFGLLLSTGDVLRLSSIVAVHQSSAGTILLDVMLDRPGMPDGIDTAWQPKQYLGAPVMGATLATLNLSHVVAAIEFTEPVLAEQVGDETIPANDEAPIDLADLGLEPEAVGAAE